MFESLICRASIHFHSDILQSPFLYEKNMLLLQQFDILIHCRTFLLIYHACLCDIFLHIYVKGGEMVNGDDVQQLFYIFLIVYFNTIFLHSRRA